jgi:hypothetical protein
MQLDQTGSATSLLSMNLRTVDERFEAVPKSLEGPLSSVLADLQQPVPVKLIVGYEASDDLLWFSERDELSGSGFRTPPAGESLTVHGLVYLASWLQEQVFWETEGAWGEPRPQCPDHSHPMAPSEISGTAW